MKKIMLLFFILLVGFTTSTSHHKQMTLDAIYKLSASELFTLIQNSDINQNILNEFVKVHGGEEKAKEILHSHFNIFINEGNTISYTVHSDMANALHKLVEKITN